MTDYDNDNEMAKIMILVTITRMVVICIPHFQACKKYAKKVQWLEKYTIAGCVGCDNGNGGQFS